VVDMEALFPGRVIRTAPANGETYGTITSVFTGSVNLAWRHSQNWNTSVDYTWSECAGGRLELYAHWIHFQRYDRQLLPGGEMIDELRQPSTVEPGLMRHRVNFGGGWSNSSYGGGVDAHYFHSRILPAREWAMQGSDHIRPYWQIDGYLQADIARWLPWRSSRFGLRAQLRVNNVFNDQPPKYLAASSVAGVQTYSDWRGRVISLSITATF
jgi:iron complex outermembrane recepter protein